MALHSRQFISNILYFITVCRHGWGDPHRRNNLCNFDVCCPKYSEYVMYFNVVLSINQIAFTKQREGSFDVLNMNELFHCHWFSSIPRREG